MEYITIIIERNQTTRRQRSRKLSRVDAACIDYQLLEHLGSASKPISS